MYPPSGPQVCQGHTYLLKRLSNLICYLPAYLPLLTYTLQGVLSKGTLKGIFEYQYLRFRAQFENKVLLQKWLPVPHAKYKI